jgi:hypothetical protein
MKIDSLSSPTVVKLKKNTTPNKKGFQAILNSSSVVAPEPSSAFVEEELWMFQEIESFIPSQKDLYKKGKTLLQLLNALHIDLLAGNIPQNRIQSLHYILQLLPEKNSSSLQEIVDEIILRVKIELAKIDQIT